MLKKQITLLNIIFLSSLGFYIYYLAPTVVWGDSAKLTLFSYNLNLNLNFETHPLKNLLGFLFNFLPLGSIAFRQNFFSAFFSTLTLIIIFIIIFKITKNIQAGLLAVICLMFSNSFWFLGEIAESYSAMLFFTVVLFLIALNYEKNKNNFYLILFGFICGLSFWNNAASVFVLPGFIIFLFTKDLKLWIKNLIIIAVGLFGGLAIIVLLAIIFNGFNITLFQLKEILSGEAFSKYYRDYFKLIKQLIYYLAYLFFQFPVIGFLAGILGGWLNLKSNFKLFLLFFVSFIINIFFASGYMLQRQFNILSQSYLIFAIWIGLGANYLFTKYNFFKNKIVLAVITWLVILTPITLYQLTPKLLAKKNLISIRTVPFRDNYKFFLNPVKKNYYGTLQFANNIEKNVLANSIIFSDFTPGIVLQYFKEIEGKFKNTEILLSADYPFNYVKLKDVNKFYNAGKNIYFVEAEELKEDYNIKEISKYYNIKAVGVIFKLERKKLP